MTLAQFKKISSKLHMSEEAKNAVLVLINEAAKVKGNTPATPWPNSGNTQLLIAAEPEISLSLTLFQCP